MADTTTVIGRSKITFPEIGYSGGTPLEDLVKACWADLSDDLGSRYQIYSAISDSTTVELDHNFGVALAELKVLIYTGTATNLTRVQDPSSAGWTIAAKTGSEKLVIEVTTPSSGGPHGFAVIVHHSTFIESISELDDVDNTGVADGYVLKWVAANSQYEPGANVVTPWNTVVKTSLYTAVSQDEVFADTSGGSFTVNLPATATLGHRVRIIDYGNTFGTNTLTIGRNGNNINGSAADLTMNVDGDFIELVANGNNDWRQL